MLAGVHPAPVPPEKLAPAKTAVRGLPGGGAIELLAAAR